LTAQSSFLADVSLRASTRKVLRSMVISKAAGMPLPHTSAITMTQSPASVWK